VIKLRKFLLDRFDRATNVGPQDDVELLCFARWIEPVKQAFQSDMLIARLTERHAALMRGTMTGDFSCLCNIVQHIELATSARSRIQTGEVHRNAGAGLLNAFVGERVVHGFNAAVRVTAHHDVADAQCAV